MNIIYTYEIVEANEAARCMEVVYSAEGYQTMHIGARLPFEGELLEDVIKAFAPVPLWLASKETCVTPEVGQRGVIDSSLAAITLETESERQERLNAEMWAQIEFEKRIAAALVKFGVLAVDPTTIAVSQL
jgi:hypothetical protein